MPPPRRTPPPTPGDGPRDGTRHDLGTNWAGNHALAAERLLLPRSVEEVQEVVRAASAVRALGSRHSFSDLTDTSGTLLDLSGLPEEVRVADDRASVSVPGGLRYGDLAVALEAQGLALANLASLPHISVAGAVATGTHGSGDRNQSLAAAVRSLDVVGPDGDLHHLERADPAFAGSVVALGALGVVVRLDLDVEPSYLVRQEVHTGLAWSTVEERFDDITAAGYSVSLFTRFGPALDQLWVKSREDEPPVAATFGGAPADRVMHMLAGGASEAVTGQGGEPGPWLHRLPHFRLGFTPSRGAELQSEYFVPRHHALDALAVLRGLGPRLAPLLQVCEVRTVAADDLWLSGAGGHDVVALHFTWVLDEPAVRGVLREMEAGLAPFGARPHWGKVFETDAVTLAEVYPGLADFAALREDVDPDRVFGNAFLDRVLAATDPVRSTAG